MAEVRRHPSLTVWTTRVSNTDRTPYSRGSASIVGGRLPWPLVVRTPSPNFTSQACTPPTPPRCQQRADGGRALPTLSPRRPSQPSRALRPVTTGNALPAMSYRNCWHIFSPGLSGQRRILRPPRLVPRHGTRRTSACSDSRPVTNIPHCCLWRGSLQPQVAGRPLSPARDRWLGPPTPNPPRAHPGAAHWALPPEQPAPPANASRLTHP